MACWPKASANFSSVTYHLRPQAKFHDGEPVTPEDVIFSFNAFKQNSPQLSAYYQHVTKAEKSGEHEITFTFDGPGNRELPQIVGQISVLPKHWYEGTDKSGKKRDIAATSLSHRSATALTGSRNSCRVARSSTSGSKIIGARTCR
jgi:microcin C transport system substrate-binding protein